MYVLAPHVCHHAPPDCSSPQPSRSELDETLKRLQQHKGVTGVIVVNGEEGGLMRGLKAEYWHHSL